MNNINNEEEARYDAATEWFQKTINSADDILFNKSSFHQGMIHASKTFDYPYESMCSLLRNMHVRHMKKKSRSVIRSDPQKVLNMYIYDKKTILFISKQINYPPYFITRLILQNILCSDVPTKTWLTKCIYDPYDVIGDVTTIPFAKDVFRKSEEGYNAPFHHSEKEAASTANTKTGKLISRLAHEVIEAVNTDPLYGLMHDRVRNNIGYEHEIMLQNVLKSMGIPFETEAQLRIRGTAKTPDILLSIPLSVRVPTKSYSNKSRTEVDTECQQHKEVVIHDDQFTWKIISWIDSKALFGDERTHNTDTLPQAEGFIHRYGPGLILYWFGHAPLSRLNDSHGDVVITGMNVPEVFMLPTGEIVSHGSMSYCGNSSGDNGNTMSNVFYSRY